MTTLPCLPPWWVIPSSVKTVLCCFLRVRNSRMSEQDGSSPLYDGRWRKGPVGFSQMKASLRVCPGWGWLQELESDPILTFLSLQMCRSHSPQVSMAFGFPKEWSSHGRVPKQKLLGVPKPPRYQFTSSAHSLLKPVSKVSIYEKEKEIQSVPLNWRTCVSREGRKELATIRGESGTSFSFTGFQTQITWGIHPLNSKRNKTIVPAILIFYFYKHSP